MLQSKWTWTSREGGVRHTHQLRIGYIQCLRVGQLIASSDWRHVCYHQPVGSSPIVLAPFTFKFLPHCANPAREPLEQAIPPLGQVVIALTGSTDKVSVHTTAYTAYVGVHSCFIGTCTGAVDNRRAHLLGIGSDLGRMGGGIRSANGLREWCSGNRGVSNAEGWASWTKKWVAGGAGSQAAAPAGMRRLNGEPVGLLPPLGSCTVAGVTQPPGACRASAAAAVLLAVLLLPSTSSSSSSCSCQQQVRSKCARHGSSGSAAARPPAVSCWASDRHSRVSSGSLLASRRRLASVTAWGHLHTGRRQTAAWHVGSTVQQA